MICSPHWRSPWRTWQSWYDVIIWQSDWLFPSNGIQGRTSASSRHLLFKVVTFPALGTMNIRLYWSLWTQVNSGPSIQPFDNRCPPLEQSMTIMVYAVIFEYKQRRYVYCCEYWQNHTTFKHSYFYVRAFSNWKVFRLTQTKLFFWAHNFVKKAAWQAGGTLETCLNGILGVKWTHEGLLMDGGTHLSVADSSVKSKRFRLSGRYTKTKNSLSQWQYVQK